MAELKQVKVDNWGPYFLQRLKNFFNRTDYCDLTLQFQNNAQLKVHRLVLNACTEYFEILERTCEMYEDCLIMPDDLQADVVVPIVNFMYTGQLEFHESLLDKLCQTAQIMKMPVLTKLLNAQRRNTSSVDSLNYQTHKEPIKYLRENLKRFHSEKSYGSPAKKQATDKSLSKRNHERERLTDISSYNRHSVSVASSSTVSLVPKSITTRHINRPKRVLTEPKPTRYDIPEELEPVIDDSFTDLSYDSAPLLVHPATKKKYGSKQIDYGIFSEGPSSNRDVSLGRVDYNKPSDSANEDDDDDDYKEEKPAINKLFPSIEQIKTEALFDQVIDKGPKLTIEAEDPEKAAGIDHAKIISEVLKKYPQLINNNKNIKLKILDVKKEPKPKPTKQFVKPKKEHIPAQIKIQPYECSVLDSKEAAKLIAMGVNNIRGPWICLICGTPGRALHFSSYFEFRRHLVDVHKEKPIPNMCEHCGYKSPKRNYLVHHLYAKHGIPPPRMFNFPKCDVGGCEYIALTPQYLLKHKAHTHHNTMQYVCKMCLSPYKTERLLIAHLQRTGHMNEFKATDCVYCGKSFMKGTSYYAHLKAYHKVPAIKDGYLEASDEEAENSGYVILSRSYGNEAIEVEPQVEDQLFEEPKILNMGFNTSQMNSRSQVEIELSPTGSDDTEENVLLNTDLTQQSVSGSTDPLYIHGFETPKQSNAQSLTELTNVHNLSKSMRQVQVNGNSLEIVQFNQGDDAILYDPNSSVMITTLNNAPGNSGMLMPTSTPGIDVKNSNIVVVYSSIDNNGKEYVVAPQYAQAQIISSQALQNQFIPASSVATSEYRLATQMNSSLDNSSSSGNISISNSTAQPNTGDNGNPIILVEGDIQNMEIIHEGGPIVPNSTDHINIDQNGQVVVYSHNEIITSDPMGVNPEEVALVEENIVTEIVCEQTKPTDHQTMDTDMTDSANTLSNNNVNPQNNDDIPEHDVQVSQSEEQTTGVIADEPMSYQDETVERGPDVPQINNLPSEWTQDENNAHENNMPQENTSAEVVESIENIQQEMENHIKRSQKPDNISQEEVSCAEESDKSLQTEEISEPQKPTLDDTNIKEAPAKISMLLTDWEENESQEGQNVPENQEESNTNESNTDEQNDESDVNDVSNEIDAVNVVSEEQLEPKNNCEDDNSNTKTGNQVPAPSLKNLVSDWDDEEEQI